MGGFSVSKTAIKTLLKNIYPKNKFICEPQMGKRGLYPTLSNSYYDKQVLARMDFLQYSDGTNSLKKISNLIGVKFEATMKIYYILKKHSLVY
jgi:aminopeptidase-like protein